MSGLLKALLTTVTLATRAPAAPGLNVTLNVQLFPGPRLLAPNEQGEPPVGERAKSAAFAPVTVTLVIFSAVLPELVSVTVRGLPEVLTG